MGDSTWTGAGFSGEYNDPNNWTSGVPGPNNTGFFGMPTNTNINIFIESPVLAGAWHFLSGASQYNFITALNPSFGVLIFTTGVTIDGGSAHFFNYANIEFTGNSSSGVAIFDNYGGELDFHNFGDASHSTITNEIGGRTSFDEHGNAGNSTITAQQGGATLFFSSSTAGNSTIYALTGGLTRFFENSTGGNAQLIADVGGLVDFSRSTGTAGFGVLTAGSIAGAGTFDLGANELFVGSNGLSTTVSGLIADGGSGGGSGAILGKVGPGTLTLSHAGNTYSGGTFLEAGTLDLAKVGAAGTNFVLFKGPATLKIENRALSGHVFGNAIGFGFGKNIVDLTGLKFHAGASAKYHPGSQHLTIHSGNVIDTLTLDQFSPGEDHFHVSRDAHGGTKVAVVPAAHHSVASIQSQGWGADQIAIDNGVGDPHQA